nr:tubulin--tyrosine ligase-like protein 12 [Ipomoea batatas]
MPAIQSYDDFIKVHGVLLASSGIPQKLHPLLFQKLAAEAFDAGHHFQIEPVEDGNQRRLLFTSDFMANESNLFLVDHAWTFRLSDAYKQLQEVPGLAERMAAIMCVDTDLWLELDELGIDDYMLSSLDLPHKFPSLLALSLCGNNLKNIETVVREVTQLKSLKALWLNDNPILKENGDGCMEDAILQGCSSLEIYNSRFTPHFGEWALGFCAEIYNKDSPGYAYQGDQPLQCVSSLDLSNRCINNLFNKAFSPTEMPSLSHLNIRGNPLDQNSANDLLEFLNQFSCLSALEVDIPGPLGENAVRIVEALPNLSVLNGVSTSKISESGKSVVDSMLLPRLPEWTAGEPIADRIINAMWLYLMTYRLADEEKIDETSVWYVMDELGSSLRHSDEPNFRVSPFLYMPDGELASAVRFSSPTVYVHSLNIEVYCRSRCLSNLQEYESYRQKLQSTKFTSPLQESSVTSTLYRADGSALRVYTDIPHVEEFLNRPEFVITSEAKDADIIWTSMQVDEELKKAAGLNDQQYINQFPFEACIVMKHHLAETVQKAHGLPEWIQPTYNLETQLAQMIGDYLVRERDGLDNLWILKPWNMARTIDTTITGNLSAIIRLMETGPKVCQKYIEHPALFQGRKFDLRYIVLVRSLNPLEIFLADIFWTRLANNAYTLDKHSLAEYETHFTVMNYRGRLNHLNTPEFVKEFELEHKVKWMDIHSRVRSMIRSVFESAASVHPEMHHSKSRAMYGVDVMLDSNFQPKLLEVTYCPDCKRACTYDTEAVVKGGETVKGRDFYNYVFGCLFLDETNHVSPL